MMEARRLILYLFTTNFFFQACIVRIMKDRKHLSHNDLVHEVTSQLSSKFHPDPLSIKRRVEHLIEVCPSSRTNDDITE